MSSHAKELINYKDSIPKLLFLLTAKLTAQYNTRKSFVSDAKLEFTVDERTFVFTFHTEDEITLNTSMKLIQDGEEIVIANVEPDSWGEPLNDTIN
jgi:hypothetical protein